MRRRRRGDCRVAGDHGHSFCGIIFDRPYRIRAGVDFNQGRGPAAPDVVYALTPSSDLRLDIDLCGSSYDTAVHIYLDSTVKQVACNDDRCGWQSRFTALQLQARWSTARRSSSTA